MKPTTPAQALAWLAGLPPSDIRPGLERMAAALEALGHPERDLRAVHVAGTNGKGSTCAFLEACLRAQGLKVGLYSSPHLERVNERWQVGGVPVSDAALGERVLELVGRLPEGLALTYFELGTAVAFWHFARERVDAAVIETGLGGRLDATVLVPSAVAAVTAIGLDHAEWLGSDLAGIAREKAGIYKRGAPAIIGAQDPPELADVLEDAARAAGAVPWRAGRDFALRPDASPGTWRWTSPRRELGALSLGLRGAHQRHNAEVALACLDALGQGGLRVDDGAVARGLAGARWPGRLEELAGTPTVVLDGAHNAHGARALRAALDAEYGGRPVVLVFGVFADKPWEQMLQVLAPRCAQLHAVPVDSPRGLDPERVAAAARALGTAARAWTDRAAAVAAAKDACPPGGVVACAGSLQLIGQLRAVLAPSAAIR